MPTQTVTHGVHHSCCGETETKMWFPVYTVKCKRQVKNNTWSLRKYYVPAYLRKKKEPQNNKWELMRFVLYKRPCSLREDIVEWSLLCWRLGTQQVTLFRSDWVLRALPSFWIWKIQNLMAFGEVAETRRWGLVCRSGSLRWALEGYLCPWPPCFLYFSV
jgi:hypothetical protein